MTPGQQLAAQLQHLQAPTRALLERIPADKLTWKPHERSMTLGRLGMHVAELPHWIVKSFELPEFDFVSAGYTPVTPTDLQQVLDRLDGTWEPAKDLLRQATDEQLSAVWTMRRGDHVIWSLSRADLARLHTQHMVHHRGQLSVYLRLLDVPIPELFGPTADTRR